MTERMKSSGSEGRDSICCSACGREEGRGGRRYEGTRRIAQARERARAGAAGGVRPGARERARAGAAGGARQGARERARAHLRDGLLWEDVGRVQRGVDGGDERARRDAVLPGVQRVQGHQQLGRREERLCASEHHRAHHRATIGCGRSRQGKRARRWVEQKEGGAAFAFGPPGAGPGRTSSQGALWRGQLAVERPQVEVRHLREPARSAILSTSSNTECQPPRRRFDSDGPISLSMRRSLRGGRTCSSLGSSATTSVLLSTATTGTRLDTSPVAAARSRHATSMASLGSRQPMSTSSMCHTSGSLPAIARIELLELLDQ